MRLLHDSVAFQAARRPDATAVVMGDHRVTYGELERESNRLARVLLDNGCKKGDRVCLALPKSPAAIIGMLATLKSGCIYVPLDVASPAPRLARILGSSEPTCILACTEAAALLEELRGQRRAARLVWLDRPGGDGGEVGLEAVGAASADPLGHVGSPEDPAHILFTSGSTGQPKGVVVTHASAVAFVEWATRYFRMGPADRVSGHSPFHFDLSTFDIYGAFAVGAALHLVPPELGLSPAALADLVRDARLTQWFSVPTALALMARFDVVKQGDFPSLERLLWCGEVLPTPVLVHLMRRLPHVEFTNLYGPTEAAIASSYHTVGACPASDDAPIPIGSACGGEELLVLGDDLSPIAPGEIGQIYIAGVGLSPGYWRDPDKTREVFLSRPRAGSPPQRVYRTGDLGKVGTDGLVYFVGRADTQIKTRGYRVELGEVETAASTVEGLHECAVVAIHTGDFDGQAIALAYAPAPGIDITPARLRSRLASLLPSYMVPSRWLRLDALPKNANGKIDRRALKESFEA